MLRRRMMMMQRGGEGLPKEYQEVEWLESTGTQYIDTGLYLSEIKINFSTEIAITRNDINQNFGYDASAARYYGFNNQGNLNPLIVDAKIDNNVFHSIGMSSFIYTTSIHSTYYFDSHGISLIDSPLGRTPYHTLLFFAAHYNTSQDHVYWHMYAKQKVTIIEKGDDKYVLVPCYRKSDKKTGMYDIVNGVFYTNQGTGEFIVGPDVR